MKRHIFKCSNWFYLVSRTVWVVVQQDFQLVRAEQWQWLLIGVAMRFFYCWCFFKVFLFFTCGCFFIFHFIIHLRVWSNRAWAKSWHCFRSAWYGIVSTTFSVARFVQNFVGKCHNKKLKTENADHWTLNRAPVGSSSIGCLISISLENKNFLVSRNYYFSSLKIEFWFLLLIFKNLKQSFFGISRFLWSLHYNKINKNVYIITRSKVHQLQSVNKQNPKKIVIVKCWFSSTLLFN